MEELKALYLGRLMRMEVTLPPPGYHYRNFVAWQEQLVRGPRGRQLEEFWSSQLTNAPLLNVPTDRPRPPQRTFRGATSGFELSAEVTARLKSILRAEQSTLFSVLLAGFQVVLGKWSQQEDFLVATRVASRSRSEFERVVGCFTNTLPLRADLSGNPSFRELVQRVGRTVAQTLEHQDYPFSLLADKFPITRNRGPLCDVAFILQKPFKAGTEPAFQQNSGFGIRSQASTGALYALGEIRVDILPVELPVTRYDLELEMHEATDTLNGWIRYNSDLFNAETVQRLLKHFEAVLEEVTQNPDRAFDAIRAAFA
jgi:non-ribosomal peptide synthetase component F